MSEEEASVVKRELDKAMAKLKELDEASHAKKWIDRGVWALVGAGVAGAIAYFTGGDPYRAAINQMGSGA